LRLSQSKITQAGGVEQLLQAVDVEQLARGDRAARGRAEKLVGLLHGGVDWGKRAEALQVRGLCFFQKKRQKCPLEGLGTPYSPLLWQRNRWVW